MMLSHVLVTSEVMTACWTHAHSNEKEEVMGLLIGQVTHNDNVEGDILKITAVKVIRRLTKQRDRVEIEPNQLMQAAEFAETLEGDDGEKLRVLGWYHSHPHITVWPSHVDLRTQANYQQMDQHFVGLIFSVFNFDPNTGVDTREVTAFQTAGIEDGSFERREVPLYILKNHKTKAGTEAHVVDAMTSLPAILKEEEKEELAKASSGADLMTQVHNQAIITAKLTTQHSLITAPLIDTLKEKIKQSKDRTAHLKEIREKLIKELSARAGSAQGGNKVNGTRNEEVKMKEDDSTTSQNDEATPNKESQKSQYSYN